MPVSRNRQRLVPQAVTISAELRALALHLGDADEPSRIGITFAEKTGGQWDEGTQETLAIQDEPQRQSPLAQNGASIIIQMIHAARVPSTGAIPTAMLTKLGLTAPVTVEQLIEAIVNKRAQIVQQEEGG